MRKEQSVLKTTVIVSVLVIIGKLFGFLREALIAAFYGANAVTDAFFLAQDMPTMVFPAIGNSIGFAFTSLYVKALTTESDRADNKASTMINASILLGVVLSILGVLATPFVIPLFAPGFSTIQKELAIHYSKITMAAFVLIVMQSVLTALLNSKKVFISTQIAAMTYNVTVILLMLLAGRNASMELLTIIVVVGFLAQDAFLIIVSRKQFKYKLRANPFDDTSKELFRLALPILLGNSIIQINNIVDKILGSTLPEGSVSAISYANTLNVLVINIFVMSLSTVLYPNLTSYAASDNEDEFSKMLINSLRGLSLILVPISCITILDAQHIVTLVFGRGHFDAVAVKTSAVVLACYAPRFVFSGIREVLSRAYFSTQDTKTPMINSAIGALCNILFSICLVHLIGIGGIALGTVAAAVVISVLLILSFRKKFPNIDLRPFFIALAKQIFAGGLLCLTISIMGKIIPIDSHLLRFIIDTVVGGLVYFSALVFMRSEEVMQLLLLLRSKLKR